MNRPARRGPVARIVIGVLLPLLVAAVVAAALDVITEVGIPDVTKDTKVTVSGNFIKSPRDKIAPNIRSEINIEYTPYTTDVTVKAGSTAGEFTFSTTIDFSRYVKGTDKKNVKLVLSSDKNGEFKNVKVSR